MSQVLMSIFGFLIAISILVAVHEWGHFFVARCFGIKVIRFSIGFGRPFLRWYDKLGTEYVLSMIPLGGYVALFGERGTDIPESQRHQAFAYKPLGARMLVLAAGPLANLLFAIAAYWFMFMIGITSLAPVIGNVVPGSIADLGGLKPREEIVAIEKKPTESWESVSVALVGALGTEHTIHVETKPITIKKSVTPLQTNLPPAQQNQQKDSQQTSHILDLSSLINQVKEGDLLKELGLTPLDPYPPLIKDVMTGYPAANVGLKAGDRIIAVNGHPVFSRAEVTEMIQPSIGKTVTLEVIRDKENKPLIFKIQPVGKESEEGKTTGFAGIEYDAKAPIPLEMQRLQKYGPWIALKKAVKQTYDYTLLTFSMLKKMIMGSVSVKNLSGPIAIAKYAGQSVSIGFEYFLGFLAVISISLGVLNLLPIPLLDGGHLMYCCYEFITGKRVSEQAQNVGIIIGGIILLSIMTIAFYNDIARF